MKKILTGIVAMILLISVSSTIVFAAGSGRGRYFVDNDEDGICDNYATGTPQNGSVYRRGHCSPSLHDSLKKLSWR